MLCLQKSNVMKQLSPYAATSTKVRLTPLPE